MTTLTEFLLARIAEDEASTVSGQCRCGGSRDVPLPGCPDRVLAECDAKREVVHRLNAVLWGEDGQWSPDLNGVHRHVLYIALVAMTRPYADHPDYRPEWAA